METRENIQDEVLALGERQQAGLTIRPITFASLLILRRLGNPLGTALEGRAVPSTEDLEALAEFLWVQSAPWDEVKLLASMGNKKAVDAAVLEWAEKLTPEQMQVAVASIGRHGEQVAAVAAEVIPDKDKESDSKN